MTAASRLSPWNGVLLLALLGVVAVASLDLGAALRAPGSDARPAAVASTPSDGARAPGIEEFRSVVDRPLFAPARRKAAAAASVAPAAAPLAAPNLELVGIVAAGEDRFILVRPPGGRAQRLVAGQTIDGWRLDAIDSDHAAFSRDGGRLVLPLARRAAAQPAAPSVPTMPPPPPPPSFPLPQGR